MGLSTMSSMTRADLIGATLGAIVVGVLAFTIFAVLGLTSTGFQAVAAALAFATMAYFLSRDSDGTRIHRR